MPTSVDLCVQRHPPQHHLPQEHLPLSIHLGVENFQAGDTHIVIIQEMNRKCRPGSVHSGDDLYLNHEYIQSGNE